MTDIILSTQNGEPVASSRDVAKRFGKRHDHVIRDIEELIKGFPKNGDTPMFFKTEYTHPQNHQKYPMYLMNRDGFSMLAMGFTGKEAVQWKLKYIEAFNAMEKQLAQQHRDQREVQDVNIQNAIDRVIGARKALDKKTAFLDECRKAREENKAVYLQAKSLCGIAKATYSKDCSTVRAMETAVRMAQDNLTHAVDDLTIVAKGYPFYAALMDSLLDEPAPAKKED